MPTAVNIVLADATASPINHTFVPLGPDVNGVFWWEDQSAESPIGYWRISMSLTRPKPNGTASSNDRVFRAKIALHEPQLETLATTDTGIFPPPTVAYTARVSVEFLLPERSSLLARKHLRKMIANLLTDANQLIPLVENLQPVY